MQLSKLFFGTDVILDDKLSSLEVSGVSYDSRRTSKGDVFIAICGNITDGGLYAKEAEEKGAAVYVGEKRLDGLNIPQILTANSRRTMAFAYANFYGNPQKKMHVIGVTGTNGKTSTAFMLKTVLSHGGYKTALIGTVMCMVENEEYVPKVFGRELDNFKTMTTPDPDTLYFVLRDMADAGVEMLVMEVSSHALALEKLAPIEFDVGIFTNLSNEHLDFHKSMDDYALAKAKLFDKSKICIYNADDRFAEKIVENAKGKKVGYGVKKHSDYYAENLINNGINGCEYVLHSKNSRFKVKTHIPGEFTVYNTMAAAVAARELSVNLVMVQNAIYSLSGVCGRLERVKLGFEGNGFSVFIDYAHTPFALENLLNCVKEFRTDGQRIVTLFGCGGDRDKEKRSLMGNIAVKNSDFVIITSDNSRSEEPLAIIKDILKGTDGYDNYKVIENRCSAIEYAIENAIAGDIVLLVGKGHEQYEIDKNGIHPFSEKEIAEKAVAKRT